MAEQLRPSSAPTPDHQQPGLPLNYVRPGTENRSLNARVGDVLLWVLAWLLALIVLGGICLIPAMCESPGLLRYLD